MASLIAQKIVLMGMDNAGKTTILNTLTQQFSPGTNIKPTQLIERTQVESFGQTIIIWDFGGQEKYREKYLQHPDLYFTDISHIFFVIDLQDASKIDASVQYLERIIEGLMAFSPQAKLILLFHKNDSSQQIQIQQLNIQQRFLAKAEPYITTWLEEAQKGEDPPYATYVTSVYNPMSIIKAISESLLSEHNLIPIMNGLLRSFIESYQLKYAILFSKSHFELGQAMDPRLSEADKDGALTYYLSYMIPTTELKVDCDFEGELSVKLYTEGFSLPIGGVPTQLFLVILYDKEQGFPNKNAALGYIKNAIEKMLSALTAEAVTRQLK
jgi:small GTP-binding protein